MNNDLISRARLTKRLEGVLAMVVNEPNQTYANAIRSALSEVKLAPAVEAEPVVHGRWVLKTRREADNALIVTAECSQGCENEREIWRGYFIDVPDYIAEYTALSKAKMAHLSNYCPNCGAKMDEEDEA